MHKKLKNLPDGKADEDRLKEVFTTLGFTVKPHQNLIAEDMMDVLEEYAEKMEDYKGKALIVIILSHGGGGDVVYGTDGGQVSLHDMQKLFSAANCLSLERAPKVFLIDACRGKKSEKGRFYNENGKHGGMAKSSGVITDSLNFATIFASTRGNEAYMYKEDEEKKGSYFTQTLVDVIDEADEGKELNEIILEVRLRILQKAEEKLQKLKLELNAQGPKMEKKAKVSEQEVMAQDPEEEVKAKGPEQKVMVQDAEQEVMVQDPKQEVKAQDPEQEVMAQDPEQEVKAQDPEQEVKAKGPEQKVMVRDPEQEVKAQDPEQEVMVQDPKQEVKAKGPEQKVIVQDPEEEVKAKGSEEELKAMATEEELKAMATEEELKAKGQKRKEITTQTVQYNSTLVKLYYIKRNSNKMSSNDCEAANQLNA